MATYTVDVKAFFSIDVEADSEADARRAADAFVSDVMTATPETIEGYNNGLPSDAVGRVVPQEIGASIDGTSDCDCCDDPEPELGDHMTGNELEPEAGYVAHARYDEPDKCADMLGDVSDEQIGEVMCTIREDITGVIVRYSQPHRLPLEIWATTHRAPEDDGGAEYCLIWRAA